MDIVQEIIDFAERYNMPLNTAIFIVKMVSLYLILHHGDEIEFYRKLYGGFQRSNT